MRVAVWLIDDNWRGNANERVDISSGVDRTVATTRNTHRQINCRDGRWGKIPCNGEIGAAQLAERFGVAHRSRSAGEEILMTEDQIAALDDNELAMHIRRVQQIASADRDLAELLHERRRRQILAVVGETADDDFLC